MGDRVEGAMVREMTWWRGVLVVLLAGGVYAGTLGNDFVGDDLASIVQNELVQRGAWRDIFMTRSWAAASSPNQLYRPLVTLSFAVNHAIGGDVPWGYHLVNVLLHALVSLLVYLVVRRISGRVGVAWWTAVLFAIHPINTEAVAQVVGRAELAAALWVLIALLADLQTYEAVPRVRLRSWHALVLIAFAAGLFSKENAVTLLPGLVLTDLAVRCRWRWQAFVAGMRGQRGALYGGLLIVTGCYLAWRLPLEVGPPLSGAMNPLHGESVGVRLINAVVIAGRYLWLFLVPIRLSADYAIGTVPIVRGVLDWRVGASALALGACAVLALRSARKAPVITWGLLFAACTYSLVSNVLFAVWTMMAERWLYLPSVGLCTAMAFAGWTSMQWVRASERPLLAGAMSVVLLGYGIRTVLRNRDWHDHVTLWTATLRVMPGSFKAHEGLAYGYYREGRYAEALPLLERALRIHTDDPRIYRRLGAVYAELGRFDEGIRSYEAALARQPGSWETRHGLGALFVRQGTYDAAVREFQEAARLAPESATVRADLGKAYYFAGDPEAARREFERALALDPTRTDALFGRALAARAAGDLEAALRDYLAALAQGWTRRDGDRVSVESLVTALAEAGRVPRAVTAGYASQALRYFPDSAVLRDLARPQ
jgi:tetratricopeptide (TPR) repeat protein